ncbi:MAG: biopolymer transporter ExbD [Desulfamplus sp.]|nr:biopolymer transporter ExbD [Desulfamplus sp.]
MLVHRKTKIGYQIQMPLTSLIDIVFMLLIYFMLTANFIVEEGIDVNLPQSEKSATQEEYSDKDITIYIDKNSKIYIKDRAIADKELFLTLHAMIGKEPDKLIIVKADKTVILDSAVKVMDIAKAAGAGRLCIATEKD